MESDVDTALAGNEELFQETRELLFAEKKRLNPWLILVLSLALFVGSLLFGFTVESLVAVVAVLLVHELGHWLGMLVFGYRNLSVFFIPFFGAAASGKKEGAPAWQEATVLLLGPLPGIVIGLVAAVVMLVMEAPPEILQTASLWFLGLNAFNLLPVLPLDGGRLFNLLLFCRHPAAEIVFLALAGLGLGGLGLVLGEYILVALAFFQLVAIPVRHRIVKTAAQLRSSGSGWSCPLAELDDEQLRVLFGSALFPGESGTREPKALANMMRSIHERLLVTPPSLPATLGFLLLYGASWLLVLVALIVYAIRIGS